ncbi:MAG: hypothetical protein JWO33_2677 [Caulobacteraceae bacterium]|nr:hypothetical protein [Caulobacteraceae bacterium]
MDDHVLGWKLDRAERQALLAALPPAYPEPVADHVTLESRVEANAKPPQNAVGEIVGVADDGQGVQAMVVAIDGTTDRPGGGTFHITWSLDRTKGREAKESNDVMAERGWTALETPRLVTLTGTRWPR